MAHGHGHRIMAHGHGHGIMAHGHGHGIMAHGHGHGIMAHCHCHGPPITQREAKTNESKCAQIHSIVCYISHIPLWFILNAWILFLLVESELIHKIVINISYRNIILVLY